MAASQLQFDEVYAKRKVSYKNTFLVFSEDEDEDDEVQGRRSSNSGSPPRARSADAALRFLHAGGPTDNQDVPDAQQAQLNNLNTLLVHLSRAGSRGHSPDSTQDSPTGSFACDSSPKAAAAARRTPSHQGLMLTPPTRVPMQFVDRESQSVFEASDWRKPAVGYDMGPQPRCPPPYVHGFGAVTKQPAQWASCPGPGPASAQGAGKREPPPPRAQQPEAARRSVVRRPSNNDYRHGEVPKHTNLKDIATTATEKKVLQNTTLMIRNMPNRYCQRELILELEDLGFAGKFDFLYVPMDKGTMLNVGYAFVNFVEHHWAQKCMSLLQGGRFTRHCKNSRKTIAVTWAHMQGLEANLAHYEKAAVSSSKMRQHRPIIMAKISVSD